MAAMAEPFAGRRSVAAGAAVGVARCDAELAPLAEGLAASCLVEAYLAGRTDGG